MFIAFKAKVLCFRRSMLTKPYGRAVLTGAPGILVVSGQLPGICPCESLSDSHEILAEDEQR